MGIYPLILVVTNNLQVALYPNLTATSASNSSIGKLSNLIISCALAFFYVNPNLSFYSISYIEFCKLLCPHHWFLLIIWHAEGWKPHGFIIQWILSTELRETVVGFCSLPMSSSCDSFLKSVLFASSRMVSFYYVICLRNHLLIWYICCPL